MFCQIVIWQNVIFTLFQSLSDTLWSAAIQWALSKPFHFVVRQSDKHSRLIFQSVSASSRCASMNGLRSAVRVPSIKRGFGLDTVTPWAEVDLDSLRRHGKEDDARIESKETLWRDCLVSTKSGLCKKAVDSFRQKPKNCLLIQSHRGKLSTNFRQGQRPAYLHQNSGNLMHARMLFLGIWCILLQIPCTETSKNSGEERMQRIAMDKQFA